MLLLVFHVFYSNEDNVSRHLSRTVACRWEDQPTSAEKGVAENYNAIQWTALRSVTLERFYTISPVSMQCNQSSGERFPGDWEGPF